MPREPPPSRNSLAGPRRRTSPPRSASRSPNAASTVPGCDLAVAERHRRRADRQLAALGERAVGVQLTGRERRVDDARDPGGVEHGLDLAQPAQAIGLRDGGHRPLDELDCGALGEEAGRLALRVALDDAAGRVRGPRADPGDAQGARVDEAVVGAAVEEQRTPARRLLELRVRREAALGEVAGVDVGRSLEPGPAGVRRCEVGDATGDLGDAPHAGERDAVALAPPPEHVDVAVDEAGDDRARQRAGRGPCGDGRGDLGGRSRGDDDAVLDGDRLDARVLRIEREDVARDDECRHVDPTLDR